MKTNWLITVVLLMILVSCSHESGQKKYNIAGDVLAVDSSAGQITLRHGEVPGFMEAMTMPYTVKDRDALQKLRVGDHIKAEIVVSKDGAWLENVRITARGTAGTN